MNTFDNLKKIREDAENDKELKRVMKEYKDLCLRLYTYKLISSISKVILDNKKKNTPRD